jgi:hypothetical protein
MGFLEHRSMTSDGTLADLCERAVEGCIQRVESSARGGHPPYWTV